jgi:hypothetical protein
MQIQIRNPYSARLKTTPAKSVQPSKYCFEKTNPISKMQNEHNNLYNKSLQRRDIPSPPKYKPDQNQKLSQLLNPRKDPQKNINFPNLSHFITHSPLFPFNFYILFTLYNTFITPLNTITYKSPDLKTDHKPFKINNL